jgi:hypothetical protein
MHHHNRFMFPSGSRHDTVQNVHSIGILICGAEENKWFIFFLLLNGGCSVVSPFHMQLNLSCLRSPIYHVATFKYFRFNTVFLLCLIWMRLDKIFFLYQSMHPWCLIAQGTFNQNFSDICWINKTAVGILHQSDIIGGATVKIEVSDCTSVSVYHHRS